MAVSKTLQPLNGEIYVHWVRRFIRFHKRRHTLELGKVEIEEFLTHLAV